MALFKRQTLRDKGLTEDQVEWLLTESSRALASNYLPKTEAQEQLDAAVAAAKAELPPPVKVADTDEYKAIVAERDMLRAIGGEAFSSVKPKFRETVYKMLDRGENADEIDVQLGKVKEQFEEYFTQPDAQERQNTPVYSQPDGQTGTNQSEEDKLVAHLLENWGK